MSLSSLPTILTLSLAYPQVRFRPSPSCSLQMTTSCCSAHLFSGRCLRRRTEQRCDCWLGTTSRSAEVWIHVPSTSSFLLITSFTAGQKYQPCSTPKIYSKEFWLRSDWETSEGKSKQVLNRNSNLNEVLQSKTYSFKCYDSSDG